MITDIYGERIAGEPDDLHASLMIIGFEGDPNNITQAMGMKPSRAASKGDIIRLDPTGEGPPLVHDISLWELSSEMPPSTGTLEFIEGLLLMIEPRKDELAELSKTCNFEISIHGFVYEHPGFHLPISTIKRLAKLGISLDYDIYSPADEIFYEQAEVERFTNVVIKYSKILANAGGKKEAAAIAAAIAAVQEVSWKLLDPITKVFTKNADVEDYDIALKEIKEQINRLQNTITESEFLRK